MRILPTFVLSLCLVFLFDPRADAAKTVSGVVNINTATAEELLLLPGIGPAKVRGILEYRRIRPFRTVEELARVKGIGRKMVRRLRAHLTVTGPTTAHAGPAPAPAPAPVPMAAPAPTHEATARGSASPPTPERGPSFPDR